MDRGGEAATQYSDIKFCWIMDTAYDILVLSSLILPIRPHHIELK